MGPLAAIGFHVILDKSVFLCHCRRGIVMLLLLTGYCEA